MEKEINNILDTLRTIQSSYNVVSTSDKTIELAKTVVLADKLEKIIEILKGPDLTLNLKK